MRTTNQILSICILILGFLIISKPGYCGDAYAKASENQRIHAELKLESDQDSVVIRLVNEYKMQKAELQQVLRYDVATLAKALRKLDSQKDEKMENVLHPKQYFIYLKIKDRLLSNEEEED